MEQNELDVRYVKLHFGLTVNEDVILPRYKASALRGGIGEMLLRANCIRDRDCERCDFRSECAVQRLMYPHMEIQPEYMTTGDSIGFVTECEDYREDYAAGEVISFNIILFGKTIVYFNQILSAVYALGMNGIGKNLGKFSVSSVANTFGNPILVDDNILMDNYCISTIRDYVDYRKKKIVPSGSAQIRFKSPLSLKYKGVYLDKIDIAAVYEAACRRLYSLACLEGIDSDVRQRGRGQMPETVSEKHRQVSVRRYSNHKKTSMHLKGIEGIVELSDFPEWMSEVLIAGELVHIGRNTSFGFGRYRIFGEENHG